MNRLVIGGFPRTGKTTLASQLRALWTSETVIRHTDDLIERSWSDASQEVSRWFDLPGPWIIEGVTVSRALRKWHEQHPGEAPPTDRCIFLTVPFEDLTPRQLHMALGISTVHDEISMWLKESVMCG